MKLTHFDETGKARMVDVTDKHATHRTAVACGSISMKPETLALIRQGKMEKGDVLGVARVAGIMAAKRTSELIPMCHPLAVTSVVLDFSFNEKKNCVDISAAVKVTGQTGVEMEALTAVAVAALTVYDMCKAADKEMILSDIMLVEKKGGKSGPFQRIR
ncbi:MAG: cyclic pyranopterin monophosphate synthase subunit MoaC [Nitrospirae bacterium]|nr:MAG: cyclic pyranopterin monophosphate synthase subunit MoaC [Nitrospirota bacterium]